MISLVCCFSTKALPCYSSFKQQNELLSRLQTSGVTRGNLCDDKLRIFIASYELFILLDLPTRCSLIVILDPTGRSQWRTCWLVLFLAGDFLGRSLTVAVRFLVCCSRSKFRPQLITDITKIGGYLTTTC